jgi:prolyl-tRNA synthetase
VEVGNIFKLGTRYSAAVGARYLDANGEQQPIVMGSYGIGVGRLLACIAEEHHDEKGLIWPISVAPFAVHLVALAGRDARVPTTADSIYAALNAAGISVLYDDREEAPGVKFNDADLLGMPLRLTVGARTLTRAVAELKRRDQSEAQDVPLDDVVRLVQGAIDTLHAEIRTRVVEVPFE